MHIATLISRAAAAGACVRVCVCLRAPTADDPSVVAAYDLRIRIRRRMPPRRGYAAKCRGAGNVAAVSAVAWASPDAQRSMVQIGLDCAATDPAERETVEGARARLLALAEGMPGYSPPTVRACVRACGVYVRAVRAVAVCRCP